MTISNTEPTPGGVAAQDDDVAAGHSLRDGEALLDQELPLHHRHAPVAASVEHLAGLVAVAEEAQLTADVDGVRSVEPVEAGRRRTGEHALADALHQPLGHPLAVIGEQQRAGPWAAVRRLGRIELALDAGLA